MKFSIAILLAGVTLIAPTLPIAAEIGVGEDPALDEGEVTTPAEVEPEPTDERAVDILATPVEPEPATYGRLSVTTEPTGAKVSLDGEYIGVSPITESDVLTGEHMLKAERPDHYVLEFDISADVGELTSLHLELVE
ncbi:MAG: PEGA domain-containing protein, partial [bacterium]|nr:PEGA domain-containing protein [bacterium]